MSGNPSSSKDLCRICEDTNNLTNIMTRGNRRLYGKLKEIEGIQNDENYEAFSSLFQFICSACKSHLEMWHDFRRLCTNTRRKLMGLPQLEIIKEKTSSESEGDEESFDDPLGDPLLPNDPLDDVSMKEEEEHDNYSEGPVDWVFEEEPEEQEVHKEEIFVEKEHICENFSTLVKFPAQPVIQILKKFPCKNCPKSFNKKISLDRHRVNHPENRNLCVQCEMTFEERRMLVQHVLSIHEKMKKHYCHKCNKMFANQTDLEAHIDSHGQTKFTCPVCQQAFVRMRMLEEHIRSHMTEDGNIDKQITQFVKKPIEDTGEEPEKKRRMCHKCGEMYVGKKSSHQLEKHFNKHLSCAICSETFINLEDLKKHMMIHMKDAPYKCNLCDKSFKHKHKLGYHMETHKGDKKFKCGYCEFGFTWSFQLHNHMRKAHINEMQGADESSEESEPENVETIEIDE